MNRNRMIVLAAVGLVCGIMLSALAAGGNPVNPDTCTITNLRSEATTTVNGQTFTRGDTLLFTNCVLYSGVSTSTAVQMLTNVTVTLAVGNQDLATVYTATVQNATLGTWWKSITVPTNGAVFVETRIVDENTNRYTYSGWKILSVQDALQ